MQTKGPLPVEIREEQEAEGSQANLSEDMDRQPRMHRGLEVRNASVQATEYLDETEEVRSQVDNSRLERKTDGEVKGSEQLEVGSRGDLFMASVSLDYGARSSAEMEGGMEVIFRSLIPRTLLQRYIFTGQVPFQGDSLIQETRSQLL